MVSLHVEPTAAHLRARMEALRRRLADFPALHRRAGEAIAGWARDNFAAEGALLDDFPSGWPRLSPAALAARRRRGRGGRVLHETGRLAQGTTVVPGEEEVRVSNVLPYAAIHHEGLGVPRRPVLPGASQARRIVLPEVEAHVREALS